MTLLIYYLALMVAGTIVSILIGLWADRFSPNLGMTVFLCLYFATLWVAWVIAVRITEPKKLEAKANAGVQPSRG